MNNGQPLVSVIIPVYNVETYLRECVDSVLNQTYSHYEVILVDDGSTDSSGRICDDYAKTYSRIRAIHQVNGGLSDARNTGLRNANGVFIYFLDSDDYIESECLQHLISIANQEKADVVFFDGYVFLDGCKDDQSDSRYVRKEKYKTCQGRNMLVQLLKNDEYRTAVPLMFYKMEYLRKHKLMFMKGILHEDELFTFLVFNMDGVVAHCHEQLYARRIRPGSIMTSSRMIRRYESFLRIYQEIETLYQDESVRGEAAALYLIRTAKNVWGRYQNLEDQDKEKVANSYRDFRKNVLKNKGFGDSKLKIKCSDGLLRWIYRVEYKIKRMVKKES